MKSKDKTFQTHRFESNVTIDEYVKDSRVKLGESIKTYKKIYLDTNHWLQMRDVILMINDNQYYIELLEYLRSGIQSKKIICPLSDEIVYELFKQSDPVTLSASINLMDELSMGVALLSSLELTDFEILYFIRKLTASENTIYDPEIFVWTKVAYVWGMTHPTSTPFTPEDELAIQKSFFDHMWQMSLKDMYDVMGIEKINNMVKCKDITEELNRNKIKYASENNSFKQIFLSEFSGVIDLYRPLFEDALIYLYRKENSQIPTENEIRTSDSSEIVNLIFHLVKKNKVHKFFPSLIISAGLHASVRNDLPRKYKSNDMSDFRHAKAALPYFDYFFTEHPLRDLITRNNTSFDTKYNCTVLSEPEQMVKCVKEICL